jgi:hypothetical protein
MLDTNFLIRVGSQTMHEELENFERKQVLTLVEPPRDVNQVWTLVDPPHCVNVIGTKWVFKKTNRRMMVRL